MFAPNAERRHFLVIKRAVNWDDIYGLFVKGFNCFRLDIMACGKHWRILLGNLERR